MNKNRIISLAVSALLSFSLIGETVGAVSISDYVRFNDGTSIEMTDADFWNKLYYDEGGRTEKRIYSEKKIEKINAKNPPSVDSGTRTQSIFEIDGTVSGSYLRELMDSVSAPADPSSAYLNGQPTTWEYWQNLIDKQGKSSIPDEIDVRYGFSVCRSTLRILPSDDFIGESREDRFFDKMIMSEFLPYRPLVVLHESTDGEWLYVMFDWYCGWVRKDHVAVCESKSDWESRIENDEFLVVTGRELRLDYDEGSSLSNLVLPMGTKLPLVKASDIPENINNRAVTGAYVVKLPVRLDDGTIGDEYSIVSVKEDVNIGYLKYTNANVLRLAFKLVGDRYGWAGAGYSNDCSGTVDEIYRCFGFAFPRVTSQLAALEGVKKKYDVSSCSAEKKREILKKLPVGSLLYFKGHIMIYVGIYDNDVYCVSATGSYYDRNGNKHITNSYILTNMDKTYSYSGDTWLGIVSKIIVV